MIGEDGQRVYTAPPGKEKALPGNIPLFSGYVANELGHGELADLHALSAFLDASPVGSVADHFFPRQGVKAKELAAHIAAVYQEAGVGSLHVEPVGKVLLDRKGIVNSMAHYAQNKWTTPEHKQRVTDAFALVPAVLQKGALVEYGQQMGNKNLRSYIYLAPVQIGKEKCVMAVRIRSSQGQQARFYLHGVVLADELKEKSRGCRDQGSGLDTGTPSGADPRDVFRIAKKASGVNQKKKSRGCRIQGSGLDTGAPSGADPRDIFRIAKKAYAVKQNIHAAHVARSAGSPGSAGELLSELTMREYLRPLAAALKEAKERGESYAAIKKRLTAPLTNAAALAHGLAAAFNTGHTLPQDESVAAANPYGCNQYQHAPGCEHEGGATTPQAQSTTEPWEKRQEERERLEALRDELDRQEEAARDAESSGDPTHYNEETARDRWRTLSREGDPQTREDIEKRLAELERADIAEDIRKTESGKTIQATLDSLKERKEGEAPSAEHHLLNEVDSDTIDKVKELSGRDVSGYRHSISAAGISHAKNRHPYLTDDDIMLLPDITSSYDSIKYEHSKSKGARLCYAKTYGDTTFEVVERIGRSNTRQSQHRLYFVTEYIAKHPADQQKPK